ncbi:hypothetical protein CRUP_010718 [Coryphaenoides rupestris]|nr:hypothetical protein CRUP_010718 [Coryphaenoides rupestris]
MRYHPNTGAAGPRDQGPLLADGVRLGPRVVSLSAFVEVYIEVQDVNDNAPQTSEPVYYPSVMENSPKDVSIIQIEAVDPDAKASDKLSYKITSGNPQGFFGINGQNRYDAGAGNPQVTISDHGVPARSTTVRVIVRVLDENDNRPQFLEKIYKIKLPERERAERERATKRDPVYRVIAADRDAGPNAEISYSIEEGDEHGKFFIEPKTGVVSSKKFSSAGEYDILTVSSRAAQPAHRTSFPARPHASARTRLSQALGAVNSARLLSDPPSVPLTEKIKAVDNGRPQKSATCRLHIEWIPKPVVSEYAAPLAFEETPYSFSVMESDPVSHMMACDHNCTAEGGNYDSRFEVHKASGTLIVARPLDAEQKSNYNLTVEATDGTRTVSTQVMIRIIDTNNHRPQFSKLRYDVSVPEDTPANTEVLQISAVDEDEKNKLTFTLLSSTDPFSLRKFRLDPGTGVLYTAEGLDHETMRQHTLTVMLFLCLNVCIHNSYDQVRDQDIPVKRNLVRVIINVVDTNDNAPWFVDSPYSGRVFESAAIGSAVLQVTALDKDQGQNAEIVYSIESGNVANTFAVDSVLGTIIVAKELDRSKKDQFELIVKASDKGTSPLSTTATVLILVTIKAGNINNAFDINPNSGVVVIQKGLDYETTADYKLIIQATNMAGLASNTTVLVHLKDENDNALEFTGMISESASVNSVVLTFESTPLVIRASDADGDHNAMLVYQIVEPFALNYFAVDSSTGAIRTITTLDYEQRKVFRFTVQVHDLGRPRLFSEAAANVTVNVINVNDCPPLFSQEVYEASVLVPTYKAVEVVKVNATDADSNAKFLFSISEGNIGDKFKMDPSNGVISIQNVTQLRSRYELKVRVSDGRFANTATVKITVKENGEHRLKFTRDSYKASVQENSPERKTLAVIAAVGNQVNEPLFYTILNPDKRFQISHTSGVLSTTGIPFDREEQSTFDIVVKVTRQDQPDDVVHVLVAITVEDENDNTPMFVNLPYHALIQMDADEDTSSARSTAYVKVTVIGANFHNPTFPQVDYVVELMENSPVGTLVMEAKATDDDEGIYGEITYHIRCLSRNFVEPHYRFTISEDVLIGTEIDVIQAESEQPVSYILVRGNTPESNRDEVFVVDRDSGALKLEKALDHEATKWYQLTLLAQSKHENREVVASVSINIQVKDLNDNKPVFESDPYEAVIVENLPAGTSVIQVRATDLDSGTNGQVVYSLDPNQTYQEIAELFCHQRRNGMVDHVEGTGPRKRSANRGDKVQHVTDAKVVVTVADVNDNPPRFTAEIYKGTVSEDDPPPSGVIAILSTTDADSEEINRQVNYFITGGDPHGQFAIEHIQNEWKVSVRKPLDREEKDNYLLNITATDGIFAAKAVVEVKVLDANDNSPVCEKSLYSERVPEDAPAGRLLLQVSATDADIRSNAKISYELQGAGAELFTIDADTGELKTSQPLDREEQDEHRFRVRALDGGGRYCEAEVHIAVEDANDNPPRFTADPYAVTVFENTETGTFVAKLLAHDLDTDLQWSSERQKPLSSVELPENRTSGQFSGKFCLIPAPHDPASIIDLSLDFQLPFQLTCSGHGLNGDILYSLDDSADGHFSIDERTGVVSLERPLDRETRAAYELRARATDRGQPRRLSSMCRVAVSVLDINDNPPVFERREYAATLAEDVAVGTQVLRVQAASRHADAGMGGDADAGQISYGIISGNERGMFSVDPLSGDIFVIEPLDYEVSHEYYLTVEATDGGSPPLSDMATVNINLTDVNDNSPAFSQETYMAVVSEDAEPGKAVVTVVAEDADGPSYSHVRYSIVDGNQGSLFTIDPTSGYTLTVVASDNGTPARSTSAAVNVDVSDVNDNPPLFGQANYSLIIQENRPSGTSVLQLSVTDRDATHNGPPFHFAIVEGNDGDAFQISQQGALVAVGALDKKAREHYLLRAQSSAFISVRVIEESVYPPAVMPLDIFISTAGDEYPGGVLGKIHATDQDVYDTLTYSLAPTSSSSSSGNDGGLFTVSAADGKVIARQPLDAGHYTLNVTVTDGRFTTPADVTVHVRQATGPALANSIAVRFASIAPEEFIGDYWRNFQRAMRNIAGVRRSEVHLVSLQPTEQGDLDVLLALERSGSPYQPQEVVFRKLNSSAAVIEDMTGVRIVRVVQKLCAGVDCPLHFCDEVVSLDRGSMSTYSTARLSFVTPRHQRTATCQCEGGKCPVANTMCDNSPCPEGMDCVADQTDATYSCVCPQGKPGKCTDGPSLTFGGAGYVRYRLLENDNKEEMKLSLRLRTLSSHATVMYAKGTDYSILEIVNGRLQYKFDCGSGPGVVSVHSTQGTAPGTLRTLNLDNSLYFGGHVRRQHTSARHGRSLPVTNGLRGCLEAVSLNGQELPLNAKAVRAHAILEDVVDVSPGCALPLAESCASNPCINGGSCSTLPSGGYFCRCPASFMGTHCEVVISPCASNPCLYGGTCATRGEDFYCQCRGQYSGQRCQLGPYCRDNPCKNSGKCIDSLDGPVCECDLGFQGDRCLTDADECMKNPCSNGGACHNTYGSYRCNCSSGFSGPACEARAEVSNVFVSNSWNIGLEEVIGIVVFVSSIFLLVLIFILIRKRACRGGRSKGGDDDDDRHHRMSGVHHHSFMQRPYFDAKLSKNIYSDIPPQVPVRPISYTPSIPSDSRNNLDRNSFEGSAIPEHPEFSTFNPDSGHGHRKTVAVCSVAPNLPPPPPSNSVVDLEPCLKKPVEDSACHPYNTRGSMSEVQSLSSFQSESCDDNGGKCPVANTMCDNSPCPEGMDCVADQTDATYSCVCPQGKPGKCTEIVFCVGGRVSVQPPKPCPHSGRLCVHIVNGRLQYKFDCGSGPGVVSVHSTQVNDGDWHSVSLEVDGNYAKLVLDRVHAASGTAPGTLRTLNLDNSLYFGGHVRRQHTSARHGRSLPVTNGLRGCLEAVSLNGQELPLNAKAVRAHAILEDVVDVSPGCALPLAESCASNPCINGGSCSTLPSGGYFCRCPASFMGTHCEVVISPCASNPCLYGGTCATRGEDFYCQCRGQYSGQRCQLGPYCRDNPCKNSGKCIDSLDGPVCECDLGFQGDRCLTDVDECMKNPCSNGGVCHNTGPACEARAEVSNVFVSNSWNIGLEEVIGIVHFLLVLIFILIRKRACRGGRSKGGDDDDDRHHRMSGVPVRPISYTPSIPSDSRNNLDRNSFEGSAIPEHPEFSNLQPGLGPRAPQDGGGVQRGANLPPPPPLQLGVGQRLHPEAQLGLRL